MYGVALQVQKKYPVMSALELLWCDLEPSSWAKTMRAFTIPGPNIKGFSPRLLGKKSEPEAEPLS